MKAAVYCGTRAVYDDMVTACKSLLVNAPADRVFFLIEDPVFPAPLPPAVTCIDVSGQTFFPEDGPNYHTRWTWMTLMRCALAKILPEDLDTVLYLDTDTIVDGDVSGLWDLDLEPWYFAGVREPGKSRPDFLYVNAGVALYNLRELRESGMADRLIAALNALRWPFPDQDALNTLCQGRIRTLPAEYNVCDWTDPFCEKPKILHYAARHDWREEPDVQRYRAASWAVVERIRGEKWPELAWNDQVRRLDGQEAEP